ncbi:thioredoxin, putative [Entamoeba histolytica HM-1:IMSS-B]|uniref:Thioredoxin, putative n=6 Tax=Entamoeba histolytica TaxID=5759 RepID=C4LSU6_ENTH1|nr:thioredoxin, putative [Entamoeba histolytica HM-1:IMSS]EAL51569.1 thioredoxin, putative [Entamoeba histolytica HM-1:IMSS]EMD49265.1 thioredoxin, putative [Entamoeba histolytica KU27]EMH77959.1 thioredoxin, putative [Entamoeba histolytica HM-1:IMSS-B]ENY61922.1 thioredoxin, putative [Entamoeba histolytica HM-1:IMSS-A]|eukprot:XP_656951.1 thioredoxin, putative [Entamoeba histolytica HM-1:IMSS]
MIINTCYSEETSPLSSEHKEIEDIVPEQYESYNQDIKTKHFIMFYHPYCEWCKEMRTLLIQLSEELPNVKFHQINCVTYKQFCQSHRVNSYPKMYIIHGFFNSQCFDRKYELIKKFIINFK